ncbi:MAG TPA: DNA-binding domain-containing protein [Burkholderiaceae bacterium]
MAAASPSLLEVQRLFLNDIGGGPAVSPPGGALASHVLTDGLEPAQRVSIYRDTSITTLVNALRLTFPAVCQLVGEEFFEGAARAYIDAELPRSAWLDEYGASFVSFVEQFPQAAPVPYLSDVAALEWAVGRALHAPEAPAIDPAQLAAALAAKCDLLRLSAHPAIGLVRTDSPADAIWHAVLAGDDAALAAIDLNDRPVHLLVERQVGNQSEPASATVRLQRLSKEAWRLTRALCAGRSLGQALEEIAGAEVCAAAVLAEHLAAGRFIAFTLNEAGGD